MSNTKVFVPQDDEVTLEILANSIVELSKVGKQLQSSRLKRRTIQLLLRDMTGLGMNEVQKVLDAIPLLEKEFLK